jgi:hypothetical protein
VGLRQRILVACLVLCLLLDLTYGYSRSSTTTDFGGNIAFRLLDSIAAPVNAAAFTTAGCSNVLWALIAAAVSTPPRNPCRPSAGYLRRDRCRLVRIDVHQEIAILVADILNGIQTIRQYRWSDRSSGHGMGSLI